MTTGSLMKVESIAECSLFFNLFESGRFTQVLLYIIAKKIEDLT